MSTITKSTKSKELTQKYFFLLAIVCWKWYREAHFFLLYCQKTCFSSHRMPVTCRLPLTSHWQHLVTRPVMASSNGVSGLWIVVVNDIYDDEDLVTEMTIRKFTTDVTSYLLTVAFTMVSDLAQACNDKEKLLKKYRFFSSIYFANQWNMFNTIKDSTLALNWYTMPSIINQMEAKQINSAILLWHLYI